MSQRLVCLRDGEVGLDQPDAFRLKKALLSIKYNISFYLVNFKTSWKF